MPDLEQQAGQQPGQQLAPPRPASLIGGAQFAVEVENMRLVAMKEYKPFWPIFGFLVGSLDVVISVGIIVLGTLIATYSNSGRPSLIRGLAIASTILAGLAALLQGTGLPGNAYRCERALDRFVKRVEDMQTMCSYCEPPRYREHWYSLHRQNPDRHGFIELPATHDQHIADWRILRAQWNDLLDQIQNVGISAFAA